MLRSRWASRILSPSHLAPHSSCSSVASPSSLAGRMLPSNLRRPPPLEAPGATVSLGAVECMERPDRPELRVQEVAAAWRAPTRAARVGPPVEDRAEPPEKGPAAREDPGLAQEVRRLGLAVRMQGLAVRTQVQGGATRARAAATRARAEVKPALGVPTWLAPAAPMRAPVAPREGLEDTRRAAPATRAARRGKPAALADHLEVLDKGELVEQEKEGKGAVAGSRGKPRWSRYSGEG